MAGDIFEALIEDRENFKELFREEFDELFLKSLEESKLADTAKEVNDKVSKGASKTISTLKKSVKVATDVYQGGVAGAAAGGGLGALAGGTAAAAHSLLSKRKNRLQ